MPRRVVVPDIVRPRRRLTLAPVVLGMPVFDGFRRLAEIAPGVRATSVHVTAMLAEMALVAVVVWKKFCLGLLCRGWFDLCRGWSLDLVGSGAVTRFSQ